jgi:hypothetical protein
MFDRFRGKGKDGKEEAPHAGAERVLSPSASGGGGGGGPAAAPGAADDVHSISIAGRDFVVSTRYSDLKLIGRGSYGYVVSADDSVSGAAKSC